MGDTTLKHYTNALRSLVLPHWKDRSIDSIQREDITNLQAITLISPRSWGFRVQWQTHLGRLYEFSFPTLVV